MGETFSGQYMASYVQRRVFVGYRGYERSGKQPLFPFGYGLSYTSFSYKGLETILMSPASAANGHSRRLLPVQLHAGAGEDGWTHIQGRGPGDLDSRIEQVLDSREYFHSGAQPPGDIRIKMEKGTQWE